MAAHDAWVEDEPIRPALAIPLLLAGLALPACGDDEEPAQGAAAAAQATVTQERQRASERPAESSAHVDRDELFTRMRAEGLRLQRIRGTGVPLRTVVPPPDGHTRYAEKSGSKFDVLAFLTPADARAAARSVAAAPSVDRIVVAGDVVVAFPDGIAVEVSDKVERVLADLGG